MGYIALNGRMITNDELGRISKEAIVVYFKVLSHQLPGRTEWNQETPQDISLLNVSSFV
jgi:hypothetical protein